MGFSHAKILDFGENNECILKGCRAIKINCLKMEPHRFYVVQKEIKHRNLNLLAIAVFRSFPVHGQNRDPNSGYRNAGLVRTND